MNTPTQYNLDDSLGYLLGRAGRGMANRLNRHFAHAALGVTCEQWIILVNLFHNDGQSQQQLSSLSCKDKTSVTRLLNNMEKSKLVIRKADRKDKRLNHIWLTPKGRALYSKMVVLVRQTLDEAQQGVSQGDMELCKEVLRKVYRNLND